VTEVPYDEAQRLFDDLTGVGMGSERMHTCTNHVAEGLTALDVAPSRDEIGAAHCGGGSGPGGRCGVASGGMPKAFAST
jgi:hypothetical protein